jgi:hypothetical protein
MSGSVEAPNSPPKETTPAVVSGDGAPHLDE